MALWSGKLFGVESGEVPSRRMIVTLFSSNSTWRAEDPKGMIDPDDGTYGYDAGILGLFNKNNRVLGFTDCNPDSVNEEDFGTGSIDSSAVAITWRCEKVVTDE